MGMYSMYKYKHYEITVMNYSSRAPEIILQPPSGTRAKKLRMSATQIETFIKKLRGAQQDAIRIENRISSRHRCGLCPSPILVSKCETIEVDGVQTAVCDNCHEMHKERGTAERSFVLS